MARISIGNLCRKPTFYIRVLAGLYVDFEEIAKSALHEGQFVAWLHWRRIGGVQAVIS